MLNRGVGSQENKMKTRTNSESWGYLLKMREEARANPESRGYLLKMRNEPRAKPESRGYLLKMREEARAIADVCAEKCVAIC